MQIQFAHLRERSTSGGWINFAVFAAKSTNNDNPGLLSRLTAKVRAAGYAVDQSALAYTEFGRITYYGDKNLVAYLSKRGVSHWTHSMEV